MALKSIKANLPIELADRIAQLAEMQDRSVSSVIVEALQTRFGAETPQAEAAAADTMRRQLARIEVRLDKLYVEKAILKESLLAFVRVWLEHNPAIDEAIADSVSASADARFDRFLDFVAEGLAPGRSLAGDMWGTGPTEDMPQPVDQGARP